MKRRVQPAVLALLCLAVACAPHVPPATAAVPYAPNHVPVPSAPNGLQQYLYLTEWADGANGKVQVFSLNPCCRLARSYTPETVLTMYGSDIYFPQEMAFDSSHNLYLAGNVYGAQETWSVIVYAAGGTQPLRTIGGAGRVASIDTDAHDNLYVLVGETISVYASGSSTVLRTISLSNYPGEPVQIAFDRRGYLYVLNSCSNCASEVLVYPAGSGAPSRSVTRGLLGTNSLRFDSSGVMYAMNWGENSSTMSVTEYAAGKSAPLRQLGCPPGSQYSQPKCFLYDPIGVALDRQQNIYVATGSWVTVFVARSERVMRLIKLRDSANTILSPTSILFDPNYNMYVGVSSNPGLIYVFARGERTPYTTINTAGLVPSQMLLSPQ